MQKIHPQFLVDENQKRQAVVLPLPEWERILKDLEDLDDMRAYDKARKVRQSSIPFEQAVSEL
ncbi:MAG: hypothetical protein ACLFUS_15595, partial [Candidatus Sumerlaeia bacterium]